MLHINVSILIILLKVKLKKIRNKQNRCNVELKNKFQRKILTLVFDVPSIFVYNFMTVRVNVRKDIALPYVLAPRKYTMRTIASYIMEAR